MKRLCPSFFLISALGLYVSDIALINADEPSAKFSRMPLMKKSLSLPSKDIETRVIRVKFAKGYKTPLHTHEGAGPRYVIKGQLKVEDAGQTSSFGPGEVFWESGTEMTVENIGPGDAEMIIFEMAPQK